MRAAELGDGIVAIAEEDALVQLAGAFALIPVERIARAFAGELVQVHAGAACPGSASSVANIAPFTVSGRFTSAKTGRSRFVKWGASASRSASVKVSTG